jgi:hypothetical protein
MATIPRYGAVWVEKAGDIPVVEINARNFKLVDKGRDFAVYEEQ